VYLNRTLIQYGSVRSFGIGTSYGGGLYVGGNLVADHSTIASCSAGFFEEDELGYAGAAVVEGFPRGAGGTAIRDSTVSDNHAGTFGGLFLVGSAGYSVTITNSTISGNGAYDLIGGIYTAAPTIIANSTIAFNTAGSSFSSTYIAAGLQATGSTLDLQSSIIARNYSPGARTDLNAFHATVTGSNNLIMLSPVSPPDTLTSDPMLGPLVDNGGLTLTHVPLAGSPAIDHGNNHAALPFDQRGAPYLRVFGTAADIGSIESQPSLDRIFSNGFDNS
jgi:hypothetical protein